MRPRFLPHLVVFGSLLSWHCGTDADPIWDPSEALPGGAATNQILLGELAYSQHVAGLNAKQEQAFFAGNSFFNQGWVEAPASTSGRDGLGPTFNARACSGCHFRDGRGRPDIQDGHLGLLIRLSIPGEGAHGSPLADPKFGGQLQDRSIPNVPAEGAVSITYEEQVGHYDDGKEYSLRAPSYQIADPLFDIPSSLMMSPRVAPPMIGLGLLEAIPETRLMALSDADDSDDDGISGRPNRVWDVSKQQLVTGRFGWKAEQPTVRQQSAGAFLGDMGLTTSLFPDGNCPKAQPACSEAINGGQPEVSDQVLDNVAFYSSTLAVPKRTDVEEPQVLRGRALFAEIGCDGCHTPSHVTGSSPVDSLNEQTIWPYTDLLLHDMGPALADNRPSFDASGTEWRTPPLWGLAHLKRVNKHEYLLHDGRARGVTEAIVWHGGEGQASADAFRALPAADRTDLVRFVQSL